MIKVLAILCLLSAVMSSKISLSTELNDFIRNREYPASFDLQFPIGDMRTFKKIEIYSDHYESFVEINGRLEKVEVDVEKMNCHYAGNKSVVSLCGGLKGFVFHDGVEYSVAEVDGEYVLKVVEHDVKRDLKMAADYVERKKRRVTPKRDMQVSVGDRFVEIVVLNDVAHYQQFGSIEATEVWSASVFAAARNYYIDSFNPSTNHPVFLQIARQITFTTTDPWDAPNPDSVANDLLDKIEVYATQNGYWGYDVAYVISGIAFNGNLLGLANVAQVCSTGSAGVQTSVGTRSDSYNGVVMAHEVGHILSLPHDSEEDSCSPSGFIMASLLSEDITEFSSCSKSRLNNFFNTFDTSCLDESDCDVNDEIGRRCVTSAGNPGSCNGNRRCMSLEIACLEFELEGYGDDLGECEYQEDYQTGRGEDFCARLYCYYQNDQVCYYLVDDANNDIKVPDGVPCPGGNRYCYNGVCTSGDVFGSNMSNYLTLSIFIISTLLLLL